MAKIKIGIEILDSDIEWMLEEGKPYRYHATLIYKPLGMEIEQASEASFSEAKGSCLKELRWRLTHLEEYNKSKVRDEN